MAVAARVPPSSAEVLPNADFEDELFCSTNSRKSYRAKTSTKLPDGSTARTCAPPGPVTTSLRNRTPSSVRRAISRVEVVDDEVDAVPAAGARSFPVGHRPAGRALRAGQQEPQVASSDIGERRARDADGEAEVAGVEVDATRRRRRPGSARSRCRRQPWWVLSSGRVLRSASKQRHAALDLVGDVLRTRGTSPCRCRRRRRGRRCSSARRSARPGTPGRSRAPCRTA